VRLARNAQIKYQTHSDSTYSIEENLRLEAEAHDEDYEGRKPFGLDTLTFSIDQVWKIHDRSYKRGTYRRGWRKRRLFELMNLPELDGKQILEVGCGQGHNSVFFAMHGAEVYGFDLSSAGIRMADEIASANGVGDRCHFRVANVSAMPYEDESFDVVVYNAVLHHVFKYPNVKEETFRVLKPGGRLFFAEGVRDNAAYRFVRSVQRAIRPAHYHGDIDLEMKDIRALTEGYASVYWEQFGLVEKFLQGAGKPYNNNLPVRSLLFAGHVVDDALLAVMPGLRNQCLEVVGVAVKTESPAASPQGAGSADLRA
jgi:ubiquinone/menaquinone biosynthesis C-methylase UbiE